jgi:putative toxin-antitoxin system antitoxin component (TIGR02293 family)
LQQQPNLHVGIYGLMSDWLGVSVAGPLDLVCLVRQGVSVDALEVLRQLGCPAVDMAWIISTHTPSRRKADKASLTAAEAGRFLQWLRLRASVEIVFGDADKAQRWMIQPLPAFKGMSATDIIKTGVGSELIDEVLMQIDSGYFA